MNKLIVIGGPTASGKTKLAIDLAKKFNGELINADSRQIYKYLDIGTNKESTGEIPLHSVSFLNPDERFSVYDFKKLAEEKIYEITQKGKLPILVGGTGLYIDAVIKDYELIENDDHYLEKRNNLEKLSLNQLQQKLMEMGLELNELNESDRKNHRRLIRQIEKLSSSPTNKSTHSLLNNYKILFLYPNYDWEQLKVKIENRVEQMFKDGIIEETKKVLAMGFPQDSIALQGIGYKQVLHYLNKEIDLAKCIELVKIAHKQYARRQRTWFEGSGRNYDLLKIKDLQAAETIISYFL